jgi:hypothetical protein
MNVRALVSMIKRVFGRKAVTMAEPKLWLTYAWKDNEDAQVDHVYHALVDAGLDVRLDRTHLIAGQRLWPQIDAGITDPEKCDGWAIYATKRSLESEPCLEEIAYALDRALRKRETDFPVIGIFPESLDRDIIPSAIATRLYVNLRDPEWAHQIARALGDAKAKRTIPEPPPYFFQVHSAAWGPCVEIRPRSGRWHPFYVMVLPNEKDRITDFFTGPSGYPVNEGTINWGECSYAEYEGRSTTNLVDSLTSAYVSFSELPSRIVFGTDETLYWRDLPPG